MQEIPTYQKLSRNPTATKRDGFRNSNDAHGIRALTKQTTHGNNVDEALRTSTAAKWKTERSRRLERVRGKLPGTARTSSRPRLKPTADAAVLLPHVAALPANAAGLRTNFFETGGRSETAIAGGELATEVSADKGRGSAQGTGG